jgi:hypothetical protein
MRDPKRIDRVLTEISNIWHKYPDMRLGQLIGNVLEGPNLYYVEDDGLISALKDMYEEAKEPVKFDDNSYILDLVKRNPGEMGFIMQTKTYEEYLATYSDAGFDAKEAVYNEHEFNALKAYFGDEE